MAATNQHRPNVKLITLFAILAGICLLAWGFWRLSIFGQAPAKLESELRLAKADGLPMDADDVRRSTFATDDQNADRFLTAAIGELKRFENTTVGKQLIKLSGNSAAVTDLTSAQLDEWAPAIPQLARFFDDVRLAAKRPKLDFHRKWELGPALLLPELADEKACLVPLIVGAKIKLREGQFADGMDLLDTASRLSALTGQDPLIIGLLVQAAMRHIVCNAVSQTLKSHSDNALVLQRAKDVLMDMGPQPDVRPAIRSEFVSGRVAVKMLATRRGIDEFGTDAGNQVTRLAQFGPVRNLYELRFVQVYHNLYKGLSQRPDSIVSMQNAFRQSEADLDKAAGKDWTYGLTTLIAPTFSQLAGALGEAEARRDVLLAADDLLEAKRKSGQVPSRILGTTGYWIDPFTERPLIYHPSKSGFVIYSVGRDGKDNGGKPRKKNNVGDDYDIPFSFP